MSRAPRGGVLALLMLALATVLLVVAMACGDDDGNGTPEATTPFSDNGQESEVKMETFTVSMADNVFTLAEFTVTGGVVAQFDIRNDGLQIHNMRVAGEDNTYNDEDDAVSDPALVNEGESAVLNWASPAAGGTFDFRCDFHPATMIGKINVTPSEDTSGGGQEGP